VGKGSSSVPRNKKSWRFHGVPAVTSWMKFPLAVLDHHATVQASLERLINPNGLSPGSEDLYLRSNIKHIFFRNVCWFRELIFETIWLLAD
jgi:hypothetical protein